MPLTCDLKGTNITLPDDTQHQLAYQLAWQLIFDMAAGQPTTSLPTVPGAGDEPVNAAGKKFTKFAGSGAGAVPGGGAENKRARAAERWRTRRGKRTHN